jgi:signal peptidase I
MLQQCILGTRLRRILRNSCLVLLVSLLAKKIFVVAYVNGHSMMPTLYKGDYILGLRVPQRSGLAWQLIRSLLIKRGAIVLVCPPALLGRLQVKRIDGMSGDYRSWGWGIAATGPNQIVSNHVFLIGDLSQFTGKITGPSADSRFYGPCPSTAIIARVFLRFWPITLRLPENSLNGAKIFE